MTPSAFQRRLAFDGYHVGPMADLDITEIYNFDEDLDRIAGITTPQAVGTGEPIRRNPRKARPPFSLIDARSRLGARTDACLPLTSTCRLCQVADDHTPPPLRQSHHPRKGGARANLLFHLLIRFSSGSLR